MLNIRAFSADIVAASYFLAEIGIALRTHRSQMSVNPQLSVTNQLTAVAPDGLGFLAPLRIASKKTQGSMGLG